MPEAVRDRPRLPGAVWALGGVSLLMDVSSEMIHSLLPVFLVGGLGASVFLVGLIEGLGESTALVVKVISGALSDRWRRRKPLALLGYGLGAASKPLFAVATSAGSVLTARLLDRVGKGIRGAPRDALVAEIAPAAVRGAAFGLRQALDTVGAFLGPLLALGLMAAWDDDLRAVFRVAVVPGVLAVGLLALGVREPAGGRAGRPKDPVRLASLRRLPRTYAWVVVVGALVGLARFSEAFLVLRAREGGLPLSLVPLVLIAMNAVYSLAAYPAGRLADRVDRRALLAAGLAVLIGAHLALAAGGHGAWVWTGIGLWGLHLGVTQGLLAALVADAAPPDLLGTAFGAFHLASGVAMLAGGVVAGLLWDRFGAPVTFLTGAGVAVVALAAVGRTAFLPRRA